jgi:hypothetical protein
MSHTEGRTERSPRLRSRSHRLGALVLQVIAVGTVAGAARAGTLMDVYPIGGSGGTGPRNAASLWRVSVAGGPNGARCADGSEPVIHVRSAPAGSPHANDWVFHLPGGGSGADPDVLLHAWMHGEHHELSSLWKDESIPANGILSGSPSNPFHDWNVVKVAKCTMDRFQGTRQVALTTTADVPKPPSAGGVVPAGTTFDHWFHGALILADTIDRLRNASLSYVDRDGRRIPVPDLDAAGTVLWTGSSGGSRAALMTVDWVVTLLPSTAAVRLVADAWFYPGAELLADAQANAWAGGSIYDGSYGFDAQSGSSTEAYYDGGARATVDAWGAHQVIDRSCATRHLGQEWKCFDELHVLMNHVAVPAWVRQDQYDRNHLTPCWQVAWRANPNDCYLPLAGPLSNAERLAAATQWQMADLARTPADAEEPPAVAPIGFAPRCGHHVGLTNDDAYFVNGITDPSTGAKVTPAESLGAWMAGTGVTLVETSLLGPSFAATCN